MPENIPYLLQAVVIDKNRIKAYNNMRIDVHYHKFIHKTLEGWFTMDIFSGMVGLEKGISASWTRNSVILNNVANVDTPDFKASHVEFETYYKQAIEEDGFKFKKTRDTHMDIGGADLENLQAEIVLEDDTTMRMDGNNVDIDEQMSELAKNTIYYNTLTRKISGQFSQLRTAIGGGS